LIEKKADAKTEFFPKPRKNQFFYTFLIKNFHRKKQTPKQKFYQNLEKNNFSILLKLKFQ